MDHIDLSGWEAPGADIASFVRIERGQPGMIERLVIEPPADQELTVSDLTIAGLPIRHGGQVAECITVKLIGTANIVKDPVPRPALSTTFRSAIDALSGINDALFFLFFLAFVAGLFCYGFALLSTKGIDQRIAWLFVLWGLLSLPGLIGAIAGNESLGARFGWVGPYFQPIARLLIGLWLWSVSKRLHPAINSQPSTINF